MVMTDLEKLRRLSEYADLISNAAVDAEDARGRIGQMIGRAEEEIRTKSLEIEVRESQINLLRHIADVLPLTSQWACQGDDVFVAHACTGQLPEKLERQLTSIASASGGAGIPKNQQIQKFK